MLVLLKRLLKLLHDYSRIASMSIRSALYEKARCSKKNPGALREQGHRAERVA